MPKAPYDPNPKIDPKHYPELAKAMVQPVAISSAYKPIGRKLLMVNELPQGALARYERDLAVTSYQVKGNPWKTAGLKNYKNTESNVAGSTQQSAPSYDQQMERRYVSEVNLKRKFSLSEPDP